jgi:plastocyanin
MRKLLLLPILLLPAGSAPRYVAVEISKYNYHPFQIEIHPGETVVWENRDAADHTVTCEYGDLSFDSGRISVGGSFRHTFVREGYYHYHSTLDENMYGEVVVKPEY